MQCRRQGKEFHVDLGFCARLAHEQGELRQRLMRKRLLALQVRWQEVASFMSLLRASRWSVQWA